MIQRADQHSRPIHRGRQGGFTLTDLLVVLAGIGVLAALLLPAVQSSQEAANRFACADNLRQLGAGVWSHQQQRGDLVPLGAFSGGVSWAALILPYMEQREFYRDVRFDLAYNAEPNSSSSVLHEGEGARAAQPYLTCPTRRTTRLYTDGYAVGDYAVPSVGADATLDNPELDKTWMQCSKLNESLGPLLLFSSNGRPLDNNLARRMPSQTSYASIVDGTSNQMLFGEKALHKDAVNRPGKAGDFTCYSFIEKDFNASGVVRPGNGGVSPSPEANRDTAYQYWGSWHPGVFQVVKLDGSVLVLNNDFDREVLERICRRADGKRMDWKTTTGWRTEAGTSEREWTEKSGRFTLKATFIGADLEAGTVTLRRVSDGTILTVDLTDLAEADRKVVAEIAAESDSK